jgi:putative ABC transport system permease protein
VTKALFRDTLRAIRKTLSRFISIVIIVALGVGFLAGLKAVSPNMKAAADSFYSDLKLCDLVLTSTVGFDAQDRDALLAIEGVEAATPSRFVDGLVYNENGQLAQSLSGTAYVLRVIGYDFAQAAGSGTARRNQLELVNGRFPKNPGECVVSVYESEINLQDENRDRYKIGNKISVKGDHEDLLDSIQTTEYTVVGTVYTPEFVSMELGSSQAGGGELCGYIYVADSEFLMDYYTKMYIGIKGSDTAAAYSEAYDDVIRAWKDALVEEFSAPIVAARAERMGKTIAEQAVAERKKIGQFLTQAATLLPILGEEDQTAMRKLMEQLHQMQSSVKEGAEAEKDVANQILDGKKELELARQMFPFAEKAGAEAPKAYERQKAEMEKEIADSEAKLADGRKEYDRQSAEYNRQLGEYNKKYAEYQKAREIVVANADAEGEYIAGKNKLEQAEASYNIARSAVEVGRSALSTARKALDSENSARIEHAMGILALYFPLEPEDTTLEGLRKQIAEAEIELNNQEDALKDAEKQIAEGKKQMAAAEPLMKQLEEFRKGEKLLAESYTKLADAQRRLADAQGQLDTGTLELEQGKRLLTSELAKAQQQIADGDAFLHIMQEQIPNSERRVKQGENAIEALPNAMWNIATRDEFAGYTNYGDTAGNMEAFALVFPVLFFLIAALVSLTTMTRMVEDERLQLGVLKAAGYSSGAIAFKYFFYAATTAVLGSAIGLALGFTLIPQAIFKAYSILYLIPEMTPTFYLDTAAISLGAAVLSTVGAVIFAVFRSLQLRPAQLMRPKAPKAGKRILLERVTPLWRGLSFDGKVTVRNLMRNKKRFIMTFAGIMACTALLLTGFGIGNSIGTMLDHQFGSESVMRFDGQALLSSPITAADTETMKVFEQPGRIAEALPIFMKNMYASAPLHGFARALEVVMAVPRDADIAAEFVSLADDKSGEELGFRDGGIYINGKTAELMNLKVGQRITIESGATKAEIPVAGIVRNYVYHYVYMTPATYEAYFNQGATQFNAVLLKLDDSLNVTAGSKAAVNAAKEAKAQLSRDLTDEAEVVALVYNSAIIDKVGAMLDIMEKVILAVFVMAAGALAFVVLYNLNNINIYERVRELATIKVLGFHDFEASMYIYRENIILTVLGVGAGLLLGIPIHAFVIRTAEIESMMFVRTLAPFNYVFAAIITAVFAVGINALMHRRIKAISMVESLKSVE